MAPAGRVTARFSGGGRAAGVPTVTAGWPLLASVAAVLAVSPVTASWSAALAAGQRSGWWVPRTVSLRRWLTVAAASVVLVLLAVGGSPAAAWWLLAVGGAVLAVVDAQTQLLPARLTYPLGAAVAVTLIVAAMTGAGAGPLLGLFWRGWPWAASGWCGAWCHRGPQAWGTSGWRR